VREEGGCVSADRRRGSGDEKGEEAAIIRNLENGIGSQTRGI